MRKQLAKEIIACLPRGRTLFPYFEDRYAAYLLGRHVGDGMPIADIKRGRFAKLLARPNVAEIVARKGDGQLCAADLDYAWPLDPRFYRLTVGIWGEGKRDTWQQTSRDGYNLVLHLNFSTDHDKAFRNVFEDNPFSFVCHPNARAGYLTLAWARLDIDLDRDLALIEEVQSDWIKRAAWIRDDLSDCVSSKGRRRVIRRWCGGNVNPDKAAAYTHKLLADHGGIWDQAMLTAAIWFLFEEIGISTIYHHDADFGGRLKNLDTEFGLPPRSLYRDLPRKFCFEKTGSAPEFLQAESPRVLKAIGRKCPVSFWRLDA